MLQFYEPEKDLRYAGELGTEPVTLSIDGVDVTVPAGTSVMRAAAEAGIKVPRLCATDNLQAFGSCRVCLVEIEGVKGYPASCTTPVAAGMAVRTQTGQLGKLRRNVMELYISDHPLDCLTCPTNGDCELQDTAGELGLRDVRYGFEGANHLSAEKDQSNPYFTFDPVQMHCLLALCAGLRGGAGNLCPDHRGPRFRVQSECRPGRGLYGLRVRFLRRLRQGLPHRNPDRKQCDRTGHAGALGADHLCLLWRGLRLSRGGQGQYGGAYDARTRMARPTRGTPASRGVSPSVTPPTRTV